MYACEFGGCRYRAPRCEDTLEQAEESAPDHSLPLNCSLDGAPKDMVGIPCGSYTNGTGHRNDNPVDERHVSAFWLDEVEVTVYEYQQCVDAAKCGLAEEDPEQDCNYDARRPNHPMNCVRWCDAAAYCHWVGKRLPTEWEWEWAARNLDQGTLYPWGDDPEPNCEIANIRVEGDDSCRAGTSSILGYPEDVTSLEVFGLGGNVSEYTNSWEDERKTTKIIRGGDFAFPPYRASADWRGGGNTAFHATGFRCAI